ncbi:DUF2267 domain-containing protein [Saccharopolyspora griseoalba]|uniref:DUF2267 domain-containing protein n=1 Tax=Saccharopolyspora griseoalba TaxID=1431848 RepID=A0ABW2LJ53_9PSEU
MEAVWESSTMRSFVEQVQSKTGLSADEASRVSRAALTTLAESVSGGQVDDLTQGLPPELQHELSQRGGQARALDKAAFLDRVSGEIATTDLETTEQQVRAVLTTLRDWAPEGETGDTEAQLPGSIAELFR